MKRVPVIDSPATDTLALSVTLNLLNLLEQPIWSPIARVQILLANSGGKQKLASHGFTCEADLNLFSDLLHVNPKEILDQVDGAEESSMDSKFDFCSGRALVRIQWLPEVDWLVVRIEDAEKPQSADLAETSKHTVQELLQEREITYRNLLAALLASAGSEPSEDGFPGLSRA